MIKRFASIILIATVLLSACNLPTAKTQDNVEGDTAVQTLAAQTVEAMSTLFAATPKPTSTIKSSNTSVATQPSIVTQAPTQPSATTAVLPTATITQKPIPCDRSW